MPIEVSSGASGVTPTDIAVELGRAVPTAGSTEDQQWSQWIADAEMLIEARLGDLSLLNQSRVSYVVRQAVSEHVRRPDDATSVSIAVDDGNVSRTYRSGAGRVTIRDEWWDLLSPTDSKAGAFSITPSGSGSDHVPWCALSLGALYCSCGVDIAGEPIFELG